MTPIDLHFHSTASDGGLAPAEVIRRAAERGATLLALTDHDCTAGFAEASATASACGVPFLAGVEVSVTWEERHTVHIVGLGIDPSDEALVEGLRATRGGRERRAREMSADLERVGIRGAFDGALLYVGNPDLISRTHFARYLVETGVCTDTSEVFRKYLTEGKPGYVPHRWASLCDAVRWITGAGGIAVIAHPARYPFTPTEEYALFTEFKAHGGRGVEVLTGAHGPADVAKYTDMALEFDLLASRGSDFHAPDESRVDLGTLPVLPGRLTPVWEALQARVQSA